MALEKIAHPAAEDPGAVAVDDADPRQACQKGAIEVFLQLFGGFVHGAADEVDLHAHVVGVGGGDGDLHAFVAAGCG